MLLSQTRTGHRLSTARPASIIHANLTHSANILAGLATSAFHPKQTLPAPAACRRRRALKSQCHFSSAQGFQSLNDTGWTIPPVAACYWVGEAMGSIDFKDLKNTPAKVLETAAMAATNAAHLAKLLKLNPIPGARS